MKQADWRIPLAFLLAPVVPCAGRVLLQSAIAGRANGFLFFTAVMVIVSLALTLVLCVPAFLVLRRRGPIRLVHCVVAGACVGLLFDLGMHALTALAFRDGGYSAADSGGATYVDNHLTAHGFVVAAWGAVQDMALGVAIAFSFWIIGFWRRGRGGVAAP